MKKDIFDKIKDGSLADLNEQEYQQFEESFDGGLVEEQFAAYQHVLNQVRVKQDYSVSQKTKASLDDLFASQSFPKAAPIWYNTVWAVLYPKDKILIRRPLVQVAAIALLAILIVPRLDGWAPENNVQLAKNEASPVEKTHSNSGKDAKTQKEIASIKSGESDVSVKSDASPSITEPQIQTLKPFHAFAEDEAVEAEMTAMAPMVAHSDLNIDVFSSASGARADKAVDQDVALFVQPVANQIAVLDLLTPAF